MIRFGTDRIDLDRIMASPRGVLLIGNHPPPYGGIPSHIAALAPYLAGAGWAVHVLPNGLKPQRVQQIDGYTVHSLERSTRPRDVARLVRHAPLLLSHPRLSRRRPNVLARLLQVYERARGIARTHRIDVIAAYHAFPQGLVGAWLADALGVPLVTTIFGEIYARAPGLRSRPAELAFVLDRSVRLLSCSRHCADSLRVLLGIDRPVDVVYYGVDVDRIAAADRAPVRASLGLATSDRLVLFVGRMAREMGLHALLRALPSMLTDPRVHVLVAGATDKLTRDATDAAARHSGRVFVRPDLAPDDLHRCYAAADIVVAPSVNARACLGLAIIEGMAAGAAVVGCRVGGTGELIEHGVSGVLIPPRSPDALAAAVLRLVDDPALRDRLAAKGRETARRFTSRETNERMEAILIDAIDRHRVDRHQHDRPA